MTLDSGHLLYALKGTWDTQLNPMMTRTLAVQGPCNLAALPGFWFPLEVRDKQ